MKKIFNFEESEALIKKINKKKIILCHGVFDLVHIGHIKHFVFLDFPILRNSFPIQYEIKLLTKIRIFKESHNFIYIDAVFLEL